jgi:hypothetical protein
MSIMTIFPSSFSRLRFPHGRTADGASHSCSEELVECYRTLCYRIGFERKGKEGLMWGNAASKHRDEMLDFEMIGAGIG